MTIDERLHTDAALRAWLVDAADFPTGGTTAEVLEFAIGYAVLAPSAHNTQPWLFRVNGSYVDVVLDVSRGLAVSDPNDREAIISVGAAVENLRIALRYFGYETTAEVFPAPKDPELCARVRLAGEAEPSPDNTSLFEQIPRRRTSRLPFDDDEVPAADVDALVEDAETHGVHLTVATTVRSKAALADLIARADREQMRDAKFRRELASWLRPNATTRADGMRGYRLGLTELQSMAAPLIVRAFDIGAGRAAHDQELAQLSPALAVLWTETDDRVAWLATGQALARLLLRARGRGIFAGFLDQPIEVEKLRLELAQAARIAGYPQLLLRLGHGEEPPPQPRRPVSELLVTASR